MKQTDKHALFVASPRPVNVAVYYLDSAISYLNLHKWSNRATNNMLANIEMVLHSW
jgi:hypothetical protein